MSDKKPLNASIELPPDVQAKLARFEEMEREVQKSKEIAAERDQLQALLDNRAGARQDEMSRIDANGKRFYKHLVDLPPVGGLCMRINGVEYYHGVEYDLDEAQLQTFRDMEFRVWQHEDNIKGSNENAYRPQTAVQLSARGMLNTRRSLSR